MFCLLDNTALLILLLLNSVLLPNDDAAGEVLTDSSVMNAVLYVYSNDTSKEERPELVKKVYKWNTKEEAKQAFKELLKEKVELPLLHVLTQERRIVQNPGNTCWTTHARFNFFSRHSSVHCYRYCTHLSEGRLDVLLYLVL